MIDSSVLTWLRGTELVVIIGTSSVIVDCKSSVVSTG